MEPITLEELDLAGRNHSFPLEALRYPVTPLGLHYVLCHYDIPHVDSAGWRLEVGGLVERPLSLGLDDLRTAPPVELVVTMECAGNGRARLSPRPLSQPWLEGAVGTARWKGVSLRPLLEEAGVRDGAVEVVFTGLDHGIEADEAAPYARSLPLEDALADGPIVAYEVNGVPLPPQHGFPLRLVVPGWYGMTSVKWLTAIEVVAEPFTGHQQRVAYRLRQREDEEGIPLSRMGPRALMIPPGIPTFPERRRVLSTGSHLLEGRAWSGHGPIERVEVSLDGGTSWQAAAVERDVDSSWAWCRWTFPWDADEPGELELRCRATDAAGNVQPDEPSWNLGGYANNAAQRVPVTVTASG